MDEKALRLALLVALFTVLISLPSKWAIVNYVAHAERRPFSVHGQDAKAALRAASVSREPIVLTGSNVVAKWPALSTWTPESLAISLPELPVVCVRSANESPLFVWEDRQRLLGRRLGLRVAAAHDFELNVSAETFFGSGREQHAAYRYLSAKLHHPPYSTHMASQAEPRGFLSAPADLPELGGQDANLFAGEAGTEASTHYDPTHGSFVQIYGTKRFEFWRPESWVAQRLHPYGHPGHRQSQLLDRAIALPTAPHSAAGLKAQGLPPPHSQAVLGPGDVLYLPPFWFHRVSSVTFSIGFSVATDSHEGDRFDVATRMGLPSALLNVHSALPVRTHAAQRYLLGALLEMAVQPPATAADYVLENIVRARFMPLADELSCSAFGERKLSVSSAGEEDWCHSACSSAVPNDEELALAARVLNALAGPAAPAADPAPPGYPPAPPPLDAIGKIQLEDYIEHVWISELQSNGPRAYASCPVRPHPIRVRLCHAGCRFRGG